MATTLGVVILNYNSANDTIACVKAVLLDSPGLNIKIVVVDNKSEECDNNILSENLQNIEGLHLLMLDKNEGYARGNNAGIDFLVQIDKPEYISIINPDVTLFEPRTLARMLECYQKLPSVGIVTAMMQIKGKDAYALSAWDLPNFFTELADNIILLKRILNKVQWQNSCGEIESREVVSGAFFLTSLEVFEDVGFFDTSTFLYFEENILAKRIKNIGLKSYIISGIRYSHNHSNTISTYHSKLSKYILLNKSKRYYYQDWGILARFVLEILFVIKYVEIIMLILVKRFLPRKSA